MKRIFEAIMTVCVLVCTMQAKDTTKPVKVYILAGQSNAEERGSPEFLKENFPELAKQRDDIWHFRSIIKFPGPFMGPNYKAYGLEFKSGLVLGDAMDNDLIFLTSAVGGTVLHTNWRPPSTVKRLGGEVGELYNRLIRQVHSLLANLTEQYPRYQGQGYELAGFIWMQGECDSFGNQVYYREYLTDFIKDVRADLGVPDLPFCVAKINDSCWMPGAIEVWAAEEYAAHNCKNVVAINTRDLNDGFHYDCQESYLTIGDRIGKALVPFSKKPVHVGDKAIREAASRYFARVNGKAEKQDMTSLKTGLVGYWKFDEEDGVMITSAVEGGATGKGGVARVTGKFGKAVKLTSKQKIEFADYKDPVNDKGQLDNMSIAFWVKTPVGDGDHRIGKGSGEKFTVDGSNWYISQNANRQGWDLRGFDWEGIVGFTAVINDGGSNAVFSACSSGGFASDGFEWHHIVVVYDARSQENVRFYQNGKLANISVSNQKRKGTKSGPVTPSTEPLTIGGLELKYPDFNFQVYDELAIWSRSLTAEEIKKLYNSGEGSEIMTTAGKSLAELKDVIKNSLDGDLRWHAVAALEGKGDEALPLLWETVRDKSGYVAYRAAEILGSKGSLMLPQALVLLKDADCEVRTMGTIVMKCMGKKTDPALAVPALVKALEDKHFDVRMGAADALAALGNWAEAAVPALIKATNDEEWWVRDSVYIALTNIQTPQSRAAMIDAMTRERHSAIWFQAAGPILKPLDGDVALRKEMVTAYGSWLLKGEGWTAPFAARGKFGSAINGLERCVKESVPIPPPVADIIRRVLKDDKVPLWPVDARNRARLEKILAKHEESKGAK